MPGRPLSYTHVTDFLKSVQGGGQNFQAANWATRLAAVPWFHLPIIAALMISRRPDALLHPQFWAEDGAVFYHDAYTFGLRALFLPLGGYLNSLSRLTAEFAVQFPLESAPAIFAAVAFAVQLLPPMLMLSPRLAAALPSWPARLAMAYFYAAMPNSYELNINLTNAQWHLAIAAFLMLMAIPPVRKAVRGFEIAVLLISGLSGPFGIFLAPVAGFAAWRRRCLTSSRNALLVSACAAVQLGVILATHAATARLATPLGASFAGFLKIVTTQIVLGALLGYRLTAVMLLLPFWHSLPGLLLAFSVFLCLIAIAWHAGPLIYRAAVFWAAALFGAALITPMSSTTISQWAEMTHPGATVRYYAVPALAWFATALVLASSRLRTVRRLGFVLLTASLFGIGFDWVYPPFRATDFDAQARLFETAPAGTIMDAPENPPGWMMRLTRQ